MQEGKGRSETGGLSFLVHAKISTSMPSSLTQSELEHLLTKAAFNKVYGFSLHSHGDGECTLAVPFREEFLRPGNIVGGPVFMAAADLAMWLAIATRLGANEDCVTVEMKTNFLGAAREEFLCSARVLKIGKRIVYGTAECVTRDGRLLTHHTLTYIRPHPGAPRAV
jgi:uncharacterized protein (TIGR00369 family)